MKDLEPYVCLFNERTLAYPYFKTTEEWITQMMWAHTTRYSCQVGKEVVKLLIQSGNANVDCKDAERGTRGGCQVCFIRLETESLSTPYHKFVRGGMRILVPSPLQSLYQPGVIDVIYNAAHATMTCLTKYSCAAEMRAYYYCEGAS
jgi:hypothetical protein